MQYCVNRSSVHVRNSELSLEEDVVLDKIGSADSNVSIAFAGASVLANDDPLIYNAFKAQTLVHSDGSLPVPSNCANSSSIRPGNFDMLETNSPRTQCTQASHTWA